MALRWKMRTSSQVEIDAQYRMQLLKLPLVLLGLSGESLTDSQGIPSAPHSKLLVLLLPLASATSISRACSRSGI